MRKDLFLRSGILFLLWLGLNLNLNAQNQATDSLAKNLEHTSEDTLKVDLLNHLASELYITNPDSAIALSNNALLLARELEYQKGEGLSLQNLGLANGQLNHYKEAISYYHQSITLCDQIGYEDCLTRSLSLLGLAYHEHKQSGFTLEEQPMVRNSLIAGAILLSILAFGFYRSFRLKQAAYELLKTKNKELSELGLFKQNLTHMIAHDMKNPLNAIIGLSQGEGTAKNMQTINQSGQQMLNMIINMLDVQKFQEAKMTLNQDTYNFRDIFYEALLPLRPILAGKQITINQSFAQNLFLFVDRQIMVRVLGNLLSNAVNFSNQGGVIEVVASNKTPGTTTIIVKDYGKGISRKQLDHIFEQYWQDENYVPIKGSTGLGLTFCKLAAEAHGGQIMVESEPSRYTVFSLVLKTAIPPNEITETSIIGSIPHGELIFKNELNVIQEYFNQLDEVKVFEVGKISKVIRDMETKKIKSPWKYNLIAAMHEADQSKFDELIRMIK